MVRGLVHGLSTGMQSVGYVSPELFRELFEREELEASFLDFSGKIYDRMTVRDVVKAPG